MAGWCDASMSDGAIAETFDVVVVGGGGAGLAAAIEARASGCSVVLLEKNERLGGSTAWSIGSITATGTPMPAASRRAAPSGSLGPKVADWL